MLVLLVACSKPSREEPARVEPAVVADTAALEIDASEPVPTLRHPLQDEIEAAISTGVPACDSLARAVSALYRCKVAGARQAWREWALALETLVRSDEASVKQKVAACEKALVDLSARFADCQPEQPVAPPP
ncbi:MAG: hypothetical protein M4D80_23290 [Myxococcota bacterium]|nr:hypothetical protein [Deltaproteobacteria bacterium]MDQ3338101.1 hypothetical protein [Myxococcota bacterium]